MVLEPLQGAGGDVADLIVSAATDTGASAASAAPKHNADIQQLFQLRRDEQDPNVKRDLSKQIWKGLRAQRRQRDDDRLHSMVQTGGGKKKLQRFRDGQSGVARTHRMRDSVGELKTDPDSICEIFACFYEDLYEDVRDQQHGKAHNTQKEVPICSDEVAEALKQLKNMKTGADDGLVAEMLKTGHRGLVDVLASFFTDILNGEKLPPETWRVTKLKVIFKKGDPELPKNYRPISIIPVMSKLFSTILYKRIQGLIDSRLGEEQYGFRSGRGCSDAVHVLRTVVEKSSEWGESLFMATLDAEKAFDRVHHADIFAALLRCCVGARMVSTLQHLYADLQAKVFLWAGAESRSFSIQRGVRQGDPLSTLLFNLVLNEILEETRVTWERRGYGTEVGRDMTGPRLTHVAFADDCTLIARSWTSMKRMILSLRDALQRRGLSLHPSKCQVQTNVKDYTLRGDIPIADDFSICVLAEGEALVVLGTSLDLHEVTPTEVRNRIASGWRLFWSMKPLLLHKKSSVKKRLRLFDSTVCSCVLWCAQSWTPRAEEMRLLTKARRAMLRRIIGINRFPEEDYLEWIVRATHKAEALAKTAGVRDWVQAHSRAKWLWGGHVARRPADSWVWRVSTWRDSEWQALALESGFARPLRPLRRRWMKWEDAFRRFFTEMDLGTWTTAASDRESWAERADVFVEWNCS